MNLAIANDSYCNLYEKLEERFLYNNDINSIHILLNLYDLDKNIKNIHPKYISSNLINISLNEMLAYRADGKQVAQKLSRLIHEEINRLELFICIEGYKNGFFNKRLANRLESLTINNISTDKLYNKKYLYHFDSDNKEIANAKCLIYKHIDTGIEGKEIRNLVNNYVDIMIESKFRNLENEELWEGISREEMETIVNTVVKTIFTNISNMYKDSFWYGLNDRVLKRYR